MNIEDRYQDAPAHPSAQHALVQHHARRCQLLIIVECVWRCPCMSMRSGDVPGDWMDESGTNVEDRTTDDRALSLLQIAYGMLARYTIHHV